MCEIDDFFGRSCIRRYDCAFPPGFGAAAGCPLVFDRCCPDGIDSIAGWIVFLCEPSACWHRGCVESSLVPVNSGDCNHVSNGPSVRLCRGLRIRPADGQDAYMPGNCGIPFSLDSDVNGPWALCAGDAYYGQRHNASLVPSRAQIEAFSNWFV